MLNTFIKNRGTTKTIIHNNHKNHNNNVSEINWDADYDGKVANISVDLNTNGNIGHYDVKLNNKDLANILNIDSVNKPIDKRLKQDFKQADFNPKMNVIYLEDFLDKPISSDKLIQNPINTHISSPLTDEELLIPLTVDKPSKHDYKIDRVYKRPINSTAKGLKKGKKIRKGKTRRKHHKSRESNAMPLFNI